MHTGSSPSSVSRQMLGAGIGMLIAGAVYVVIDNISTSSLSGLLVGTKTISENAHQVRVNDKTISDDDLRRLESNARKVAAATKEAETYGAETQVVQNALVARADSRRADRMRRFHDDGTPVQVVTQVEEASRLHSGAPKAVSREFVEQAVVPVEEAKTAVSTTPAKALPSSGMGTTVVAMASMVAAAFLMRRKIAA